MKTLASFYAGYAVIVGGLLYLLILVGTQAARSEDEVVSGLIFGLLPPVPMLVIAVCLWRDWKYAPRLAVAAPVVMAVLVALVWGKQPLRTDPETVQLAIDGAISQLYFLPGAAVLGLCVMVYARRKTRRNSHENDFDGMSSAT